MSFLTMASEATGIVPKLPFDYAKTLVNRAWRDVRRQNLWSFLTFEANWTSPGIVNAGTVTTVQGANTVQFNAAAQTAINSIGFIPSPVTQRQFRIGVGTIYSIWGYDTISGIATLDRAYQEASSSNSSYMIYQCYFPAPMKDWWQWLDIRDCVNWNYLVTTATRTEIDFKDPQRTIYYIPTHVVPYRAEPNPNSPYYGWQTFELWGQPQYQLTYQLYGIRKGVDLSNPQDELPPQIGEDCVMELVNVRAYKWAEANKQDARNQGSDFRFLVGESMSEYQRLFREYRRQDRAAVDHFRTRLRREWSWPNLFGWYSSISGYASPGAPW